MRVRSKYINADAYEYALFIEDFGSIIPYFYTASNSITYNLILTIESKNTIQELDTHLKTRKKNPEFNRSNIKIYCVTEDHVL